MALPDFDIKCYLTPQHTTGFQTKSSGATWLRPYALAYLNLGNANDTVPQVYQYVHPQRFEDGLRAPFNYIEIEKHLTRGSTARMKMRTFSDRDIFNLADNEYNQPSPSARMMPRAEYPYRMWEINLKSGTDGSFPTSPMFRGMLTRVMPTVESDIRTNMDGSNGWTFDFKSLDAGMLQHDAGSWLWHHRVNDTSDNYHMMFDNTDTLTFDQAITRIKNWMNIGRPSKDFPVSYAYTEKATAPYDVALDNAGSLSTLVDVHDKAGTWQVLSELLGQMGALESAGNMYVPTLTVNDAGTTATIDVVAGGYDKDHAVDEDFRSTTGLGIQKDTSAVMGSNFNMIYVPFNPTANDEEYWLKFTLSKSDGEGGWDVVYSYPPDGTSYEYVPFDPFNTHTGRYYTFPLQLADTYKWDADLVTAGSFTIKTTGATGYSPPSYALLPSHAIIDYGKVKSLFMTQGLCHPLNINTPEGDPIKGCVDGGTNAKCPDQIGVYPDYDATNSLTGTLTFTNGSATVTGSSTTFTTEVFRNWLIQLDADGTYVTVESVESDTSLTLSANYSDTGGSGASTSREGTNEVYGIRGQIVNINSLSSENDWDTVCRKYSKRMYECRINTDSSIRDPLEATIVFKDGWTTDLVGSYLEIYSPELDDVFKMRCLSQKHVFSQSRLETTMTGYRA